jgi:hypothetical protein
VGNDLSTGLTIGRLNTIRSVVRYYSKKESGRFSREVCIISHHSKSEAFSQKGDSGSVVVDGKGRIVGILTGGAGAPEGFDTTYVTPISFIIERMKQQGYKANLFPAAADLWTHRTSLHFLFYSIVVFAHGLIFNL